MTSWISCFDEVHQRIFHSLDAVCHYVTDLFTNVGRFLVVLAHGFRHLKPRITFLVVFGLTFNKADDFACSPSISGAQSLNLTASHIVASVFESCIFANLFDPDPEQTDQLSRFGQFDISISVLPEHVDLKLHSLSCLFSS